MYIIIISDCIEELASDGVTNCGNRSTARNQGKAEYAALIPIRDGLDTCNHSHMEHVCSSPYIICLTSLPFVILYVFIELKLMQSNTIDRIPPRRLAAAVYLTVKPLLHPLCLTDRYRASPLASPCRA